MAYPFHRAYVRIDSRENVVEVIRGWPVPAASSAKLEVSALLYLGTVGLVRVILELFPNERGTVSEYFRDIAQAIEDGTWNLND